jgi:Zn-dependent peptidase ImmA (M78 family)
MPNDEAYFDPFEKILYIRETTFEAGHGMFVNEPERRRARFTLAEEAGHIWLKHSGVRYRGNSGEIQEKMVKQIRQEEREARRFAGTFLAPSYLTK